MLHCWGLHLQQLLLPLPQALGHQLGLGAHQGALALLHSGLGDQQGPAGQQEAHQLLPELHLVPEGETAGCMAFILCMCVVLQHRWIWCCRYAHTIHQEFVNINAPHWLVQHLVVVAGAALTTGERHHELFVL